jgi:hypothetical protein
MSQKDLPPVPPAVGSKAAASRRRNIDKQGRQGNVAVNTRNQGYQQDR